SPGATWGWPSPPSFGGHSRLPARSALNGAHWAPPPKGEARLGFAQAFGGAHTWLPLWGRYVPVGRCPAADRGGSRDAGTAAAVTERATALPSGKNASLFP